MAREKTESKTRRVRVYTRLTAPLRERLSSYCAASGVAECAVFEAAVQQYIEGATDVALVLRRLDRLGHAEARLQRELELLSEAFAVFVRLWFAHTPSLPEEVKVAARDDAEDRYGHFVQYVTQRFSGGHRFLDDLPQEGVARREDLDGPMDQGPSET